MAELNTGGGDEKGKKVRSKKQNSKVDLTAMVDLAFLLITFFMLTTSLSKPQSMDLSMPDTKSKVELKIADARTLTVLIGENNKIMTYMGQFAAPIEAPSATTFGKEGIRKILLAKVKSVPIVMQDAKKGLIVIIKATKKSNYKNIVDILDEMAIAKVKTYAIVKIEKAEEALLKE
jgi:biopolymer transport protein ExbD